MSDHERKMQLDAARRERRLRRDREVRAENARRAAEQTAPPAKIPAVKPQNSPRLSAKKTSGKGKKVASASTGKETTGKTRAKTSTGKTTAKVTGKKPAKTTGKKPAKSPGKKPAPSRQKGFVPPIQNDDGWSTPASSVAVSAQTEPSVAGSVPPPVVTAMDDMLASVQLDIDLGLSDEDESHTALQALSREETQDVMFGSAATAVDDPTPGPTLPDSASPDPASDPSLPSLSEPSSPAPSGLPMGPPGLQQRLPASVGKRKRPIPAPTAPTSTTASCEIFATGGRRALKRKRAARPAGEGRQLDSDAESSDPDEDEDVGTYGGGEPGVEVDDPCITTSEDAAVETELNSDNEERDSEVDLDESCTITEDWELEEFSDDDEEDVCAELPDSIFLRTANDRKEMKEMRTKGWEYGT
ncbi:hypothetical protein BBJ28_00024091 [Nothophytophthora sp. Chile5]|nr:hypothetical protein BBJ28_00024091 [Nothophytophthora sp. Chile5]